MPRLRPCSGRPASHIPTSGVLSKPFLGSGGGGGSRGGYSGSGRSAMQVWQPCRAGAAGGASKQACLPGCQLACCVAAARKLLLTTCLPFQPVRHPALSCRWRVCPPAAACPRGLTASRAWRPAGRRGPPARPAATRTVSSCPERRSGCPCSCGASAASCSCHCDATPVAAAAALAAPRLEAAMHDVLVWAACLAGFAFLPAHFLSSFSCLPLASLSTNHALISPSPAQLAFWQPGTLYPQPPSVPIPRAL